MQRCALATPLLTMVVALALVRPAWGADPAAVLYTTLTRQDAVAAYYIRSDGHLEARRFQRIAVATNPRRLVVTARALYVISRRRIEAFRIDPATGTLSPFTGLDGEIMQPAALKSASFQYAIVDPAERYLYVAATGLDRILGYPIAADGSVSEIGACTQGGFATRYQGLAATATTLYASAHNPGRIDIFPLRETDGALQALDTKPGSKDDENGDGSLQVFSDCNRGTITFAPDKSRRLNVAKALLVNDDMLYISDVYHNRLVACPIAPDGTLPDCPRRAEQKRNPDVSRTKSGGEYEQLALSPAGVLFASVFNNGTLRAFVLQEEGRLPRKAKRRNPANIFSTPVGLAACNDALYVAQGDLDRIEAFRIDPNGFGSTRAFSKTAKIARSFPNDVAVLPLGSATCGP